METEKLIFDKCTFDYKYEKLNVNANEVIFRNISQYVTITIEDNDLINRFNNERIHQRIVIPRDNNKLNKIIKNQIIQFENCSLITINNSVETNEFIFTNCSDIYIFSIHEKIQMNECNNMKKHKVTITDGNRKEIIITNQRNNKNNNNDDVFVIDDDEI